jgi:hypothetical protein
MVPGAVPYAIADNMTACREKHGCESVHPCLVVNGTDLQLYGLEAAKGALNKCQTLVRVDNLQGIHRLLIDVAGDNIAAVEALFLGILDRLLNLPNAAFVSVESACLAQ